MTRLLKEDLNTIALKEYDKFLNTNIKAGLLEISEKALGIKVEKNVLTTKKVRVVPITSGEGIIQQFSESVERIVRYLGFNDCSVTEHSDVWGYSEAYNDGADIIFSADDYKFTAVNTKTKVVRDNGDDTGRGYAAALDLACNGVKDKEILVIGGGVVGKGAIDYLVQRGAIVTLYDIDKIKAEELKKMYSIFIYDNLDNLLLNHNLIIDCTPEKDIISPKYINEDTIISTPGIPLGIEKSAVERQGGLLIHDVLEIGVAVMALGAI